MKKDYVSLKVQVIEVQLSDCIAGSGTNEPEIKVGTSKIIQLDGRSQGNGTKFHTW